MTLSSGWGCACGLQAALDPAWERKCRLRAEKQQSHQWALTWCPTVPSSFIHFFPSQQWQRGSHLQPGGVWEILVWYSVLATTLAQEPVGIKGWKVPGWIIAIMAFWKITNLIPSKMSLEFARSYDGENKMLFLEIFHALWFLKEILKTLQRKIMCDMILGPMLISLLCQMYDGLLLNR